MTIALAAVKKWPGGPWGGRCHCFHFPMDGGESSEATEVMVGAELDSAQASKPPRLGLPHIR